MEDYFNLQNISLIIDKIQIAENGKDAQRNHAANVFARLDSVTYHPVRDAGERQE